MLQSFLYNYFQININLIKIYLPSIFYLQNAINLAVPLGPEHTGHFVQPHVAAHCGGPEHTGRHVAATCMLCMQTLCLWRGRATACRTLEPQTAVCSPEL